MLAPYVTGVPVQVTSVKIAGAERTQAQYFDRQLFDAVNESGTLGMLHRRLDVAVDRMKSYGIFDAVEVDIRVRNEDLVNNRYDAEVVVSVKEKQMGTLKVETFVKAGHSSVGDVGVEIAGALRNPLGYGEVAQLRVNRMKMGAQEFSANVTAPYPVPQLRETSITAKSSTDNTSLYTSYFQKESGLVVSSELNPSYVQRALGLKTSIGKHRLEYSFLLRDEVPVEGSCPEAILLTAGASTLSSLKYRATSDCRNSTGCNATRGALLEAEVEVAVPPGTAQFVKGGLRGEWHKPLGPSIWGQDGLTGSLSTSLGLVHSFTGKTCLSDRYYLGGPLSLRGFGMFGCGSKCMSSSGDNVPLGGNTRVACLAMLSCPVPIQSLAQSGCRSFAFLNIGSLGQGLGAALPFGYPRASLGVGMSVAFGVARFEVTYAVPMLSAPNDTIKQFQLGAGLTIV